MRSCSEHISSPLLLVNEGNLALRCLVALLEDAVVSVCVTESSLRKIRNR